jgi:hypothetical protein
LAYLVAIDRLDEFRAAKGLITSYKDDGSLLIKRIDQISELPPEFQALIGVEGQHRTGDSALVPNLPPRQQDAIEHALADQQLAAGDPFYQDFLPATQAVELLARIATSQTKCSRSGEYPATVA